jgi:hypothetical protein
MSKDPLSSFPKKPKKELNSIKNSKNLPNNILTCNSSHNHNKISSSKINTNEITFKPYDF